MPEMNLKSKSTFSSLFTIRALIVAVAEGAAATIDFKQKVHAPFNFDKVVHCRCQSFVFLSGP